MNSSRNELDITNNIKLIEMLKCRMLGGVSDLYANLADTAVDSKERADILADILIVTYLLSNRLGISPHSLNSKVISKLKLGLLEEDNSMYGDLANLLKHLGGNR